MFRWRMFRWRPNRPPRRGDRRALRHRWRILALAVVALLILGGGGAAWYAAAGPRANTPPVASPAHQTTMLVTMHLGCGGCVPCPRTCPACNNKLAAVVRLMPGVTKATFTERRAYGIVVVQFHPQAVKLATIQQTIQHSPPYPSCCTGLSVVSEHAA